MDEQMKCGAGDGADKKLAVSERQLSTSERRRKEIKELRKQIVALQSHHAQLLGADRPDEVLAALSIQNAALRDIVRGRQLVIERAQLMLSQAMSEVRAHPMYSYIHLPEDWAARREVLLGMKNAKLTRVYEYISARNHGLDLSRPHWSVRQFEGPDGSFNLICSQVMHFEGVRSVQQVYDALVFYLSNMEIFISERLGQTTVREDFDAVDLDARISSHRLVSDTSKGVSTEYNAVVFSQLIDQGHPEFGCQQCGLVATDAVDRDDRYPYRPHEYIRKDITAGIVLSPLYRPRRQNCSNLNGQGDDYELVVVMQRIAWLRFPRTELKLSPRIVQELREEIGCWGPIMMKAMQSMLYGKN